LDAEQGDVTASDRGICGGVPVGRGAWANLAAVGLTVGAMALDALDGHIARKKKMATPVGAQLDILGDRMIENVYFTYFAAVGWCRCGCRFCFLRAGR